jgi:dihydropyrimidinase
MSLLIKNGRVVTATEDRTADIFIQHEQVTLVAPSIERTADTVLDASGKLVFPGGIDPHTHLDMPYRDAMSSSDDFESGTRAAAFGGTTSIIDFPTQVRGGSTLDALEQWHRKADGRAFIDYGFHMIVTDMPCERLPELDKLAETGLTSFKLFMAYPGALYMDDGMLLRVMQKAGELGCLVSVHAENGIAIDELVRVAVAKGAKRPDWHAKTRPAILEAEAVHRAAALAQVARVPLCIVHLSSALGLEEVSRARTRGEHVYAETCPQYLFLDDSRYDEPDFEGAKWIMTPPLRKESDQEALWEGLAHGHIQVTATDHCPFLFKSQKSAGRDDFRKIPNGAPGIENRMALIYEGAVASGRMDLQSFVAITSTNAAKLFGLYPRKGTIAPGSDADIVIFAPDRRETISVGNPATHHMRVDYSAYEGMAVRGYPETVISRGAVLCHQGRFIGRLGHGRFLKRGRFGNEP